MLWSFKGGFRGGGVQIPPLPPPFPMNNDVMHSAIYAVFCTVHGYASWQMYVLRHAFHFVSVPETRLKILGLHTCPKPVTILITDKGTI